jgi:uncharacterized membrane protein YeaQ/YmgE (transglycosylase-associated protein family)
MQIVYMLVIGLVVGAVARFLLPGRDPGGIVTTMLLGIAGSIVAGILGHALGLYHESWVGGFIASIIGAMLLLLVYRLLLGSRWADGWRS